MEISLQFGYGMMGHCRELINRWGNGMAILSPRDLSPAQIRKLGEEMRQQDGSVLIDPQCYVHAADHARLNKHVYFQMFAANSTATLLGGAATEELILQLQRECKDVGANQIILPGIFADVASDDWFSLQEIVIETSAVCDLPPIATIAVSASVVADEEQIERIIEEASGWDVTGFYVVVETPPSQYLVDDPVWMANTLLLLSGLKLLQKTVILGYGNQQMLAAAACKVDYVASGTWLNVRSFDPAKFMVPEEGTMARRTTWYYSPTALSEYKIPYLDVAHRAGILSELQPPHGYPTTYAAPLFAGVLPSSVNWSEKLAFRHYLTSLHHQSNLISSATTYEDTVANIQQMLDEASISVELLKRNGVLSQGRDMTAAADAVRAGLALLHTTRGSVLKRRWATL